MVRYEQDLGMTGNYRVVTATLWRDNAQRIATVCRTRKAQTKTLGPLERLSVTNKIVTVKFMLSMILSKPTMGAFLNTKLSKENEENVAASLERSKRVADTAGRYFCQSSFASVGKRALRGMNEGWQWQATLVRCTKVIPRRYPDLRRTPTFAV